MIFAYKVKKDKKYIDIALLAFEWFLGNNRNKLSLVDEWTGGVHDGLTHSGLNQNEGAESIVCFLIAQYNLREFITNKTILRAKKKK